MIGSKINDCCELLLWLFKYYLRAHFGGEKNCPRSNDPQLQIKNVNLSVFWRGVLPHILQYFKIFPVLWQLSQIKIWRKKVCLKLWVPTIETKASLNKEKFLLHGSLEWQISLACTLLPKTSVKQHSWLVKRRQYATININCITSHHLAPPAWKWWPVFFSHSWQETAN